MKSNASVELFDKCLASSFFARTPLMIGQFVRISEVVDRFDFSLELYQLHRGYSFEQKAW